ncbi:MAG: alanine racemase [Paracoccaceae bacterium]|jgi:alanine racemase
MTTATLTIDLDAIASNWRALDAQSGKGVETAAVIKAFAYGLDSKPVAKTLAEAGARTFFVADISEAHRVYAGAGHLGPKIFVFSSLMSDADALDYRETGFIPLLNSIEQVERFLEKIPENKFGFQIDTGMNRLGFEEDELSKARELIGDRTPELVISHLACADEPDHPQNAAQLAEFKRMTDGWDVRRSLAATGGLLMGPDYHFDLCRPGVGLYGSLPFKEAKPAVSLSIQVIQVRHVAKGETVGYSAAWTALRPSKIATVGAGYADGLIRSMGPNAKVWAGDQSCPVIGRVSMDMLTVDVTDLRHVPNAFDIIGPHQSVDDLAALAGTIGYEILTSLGARYKRVYKGG